MPSQHHFAPKINDKCEDQIFLVPVMSVLNYKALSTTRLWVPMPTSPLRIIIETAPWD